MTAPDWPAVKEALSRFEVATNETLEGQSGVFIAPANIDDGLVVFEAASEWLKHVWYMHERTE